MKRRLLVVLGSLFFAILIYCLFAVFADWEQTWAVVKNLGWALWAPILLLSFANYFARYLRWVYYLKRIDKFKLPGSLHHFLIYLTGFALTTTPGKAGEGLRAFYLKPYGVAFMQSLSALFTERLTDLVAIVLLSLLIVWQFPQYQFPVLFVLVIFIVLVPILSTGKILNIIDFFKLRLPVRFQGFFQHLKTLFASSSVLLSPSMFTKGVLLGVLAWLFEAYGFYFLLDYMGLDISLTIAIAIYSTAVLVGALSFLPGGLGGTEVVMVVLLVAFGVDETQAVAATLVCRVATLWFAVVLGIASLAFLLRDGLPDWENKEITLE